MEKTLISSLMIVFFIWIFPFSSSAEDIYSSKYVHHENKSKKIIIFIHGFNSNPNDAWTQHSDTKTSYWPDLITEDNELKNYDTFAVGYKTNGLGINDIASDILETLKNEKVFAEYDDIYVIAHSLGGLIFKSLIWDMETNSREKKNLAKFKAVMFLSTPTLGTGFDLISKMAKLLGLNINQKPLSELLPQNNCPCEPLKDIENNWIKYLNDPANNEKGQKPIVSFCAYENKDTCGIKIVGLKDMATQTNEPYKVINEDHIGIAKPENIKSEVFVWTKMDILSVDGEIHPSASN